MAICRPLRFIFIDLNKDSFISLAFSLLRGFLADYISFILVVWVFRIMLSEREVTLKVDEKHFRLIKQMRFLMLLGTIVLIRSQGQIKTNRLSSHDVS